MISNIYVQFLSAVFYLFACLSLGVFILRRFELRSTSFHPSTLVFLSLAFVLGAGIISSVWMLLALGGLFRLRFILPSLGICAFLGLFYMKQLAIRLIDQLKNIWMETRTYSWAWQGIAVLSSILLLLGLFSMGNWAGDAFAYYLAVPKVVAHSGKLSILPTFEQLMSAGLYAEMHAAYFLKTGEPVFLKLFSGISSFCTAIILMGISGKAGQQRKGKWLVLAAYVTSSVIFMSVGDGKPDIIAASVGIAAYYLAFTNGPVSLIGILCGLAGTMKLSYIGTMFPGIALLIIWNQVKNDLYQLEIHPKKGRLLQTVITKGIQIGAWCLLAAVPHFIKNGLLFNAPFAPIGLSGMSWMDQDWFGPETTRRLLLLYPIALTWGKFWAQGGNLSPLLIAFFPLNIFLPKPKNWFKNPLVAISLAGLIGIFFWILRYPSVFAPRYYLPTLLMFFPIGIRGAEYIIANDVKPKILKFFTMVGVLTILISVGITSSTTYYNPSQLPKYFAGLSNSCDYGLPLQCSAENKISEDAPLGARVYLASWYRYWLRSDLLQCTNGIADLYIDNSSPEELWMNLYERGFTYLFVDGSRPKFDPEIQSLPDWVAVQRLSPPEQPVAAYKLEFTDVPSGKEVKVTCERHENAADWELVNK